MWLTSFSFYYCLWWKILWIFPFWFFFSSFFIIISLLFRPHQIHSNLYLRERKKTLSNRHLFSFFSLFRLRIIWTHTHRDYRSISEFFTRQLRPDVRTISDVSCVVSPVDGRVLHFGLATGEQIEQVSVVKKKKIQLFVKKKTTFCKKKCHFL